MLKGTWRRGWGRDWVWEGGLGERVDGKRIRADWGEGCWGKERGPEIGEGWKRHKREERWTPCEFEMGVWTGDLEEEIPITFPVPFCALWPHITLAGLWQSEGSLLPSIPQQNWLPRNALRHLCFCVSTGPLVSQWPSVLCSTLTDIQMPRGGPCFLHRVGVPLTCLMASMPVVCPVLSTGWRNDVFFSIRIACSHIYVHVSYAVLTCSRLRVLICCLCSVVSCFLSMLCICTFTLACRDHTLLCSGPQVLCLVPPYASAFVCGISWLN